MARTPSKVSESKESGPDMELYQKQLILDHLIRTDKLSERTLMARAGFDYDVEVKNRLAEAEDRKKLSHILQSPYKE